MRGVQGLADGAAQIGFEGVTVAAVLALVGGERRLDGVGVLAEEVMGEPALLKHPGRQPDEVLGTRQRGVGGVRGCSGTSHVPDGRPHGVAGKPDGRGCTLRSGILASCG